MNKKKDVESMMMDIVDYGEHQVFLDIEMVCNPIQRALMKGVYYRAVKMLSKKGKEDV